MGLSQGGGGGATPTGTGFRHVTSGTEDAAAKLVENADVDAAAAIAGSKISPDFGAQNIVTTGTLTSAGATMHGTVTSPDATSGAKATVTSTKPATVTTSDATATTLDSFSFDHVSGKTVVVTYVVQATSTASAEVATYIRTACFRSYGGTVTQVGSTQDGGTFEDDAAWDCTIDVSGTTIRCRVTGKAATNIRWACVSERLEVAY